MFLFDNSIICPLNRLSSMSGSCKRIIKLLVRILWFTIIFDPVDITNAFELFSDRFLHGIIDYIELPLFIFQKSFEQSILCFNKVRPVYDRCKNLSGHAFSFSLSFTHCSIDTVGSHPITLFILSIFARLVCASPGLGSI